MRKDGVGWFGKGFWLAAWLALALFAFKPSDTEARMFEECIYIVPSGSVDMRILSDLKSRLPGVFPMSVRAVVDPDRRMPAAAYDPRRKQYDAQAVLDAISQEIVLTLINERALIVTDADLYLPGKDFVLGHADAKKGIGIISLARLGEGLKASDGALFKRAFKEGAYQLARSWKVADCSSAKCMMCASRTVQDIDKERDSFCYKCRIALENRYGGDGLFGAKLKQF